jgi:gliding motility-associated lipoprotein GldH
MKTTAPFFVLIFFAIHFTSCDSRRVYEENKEIPDAVWDADNKIAFEFEVPDTVSVYNTYINVRNASQYPYSNLFLFITATFPDGTVSKDTVDCILQDDAGNWLGDGLGDLWDNQIVFKPAVRFPKAGKYKIEFEQAMRQPKLPMIMDVGFRLEKAK